MRRRIWTYYLPLGLLVLAIVSGMIPDELLEVLRTEPPPHRPFP